MSVWVCVWLQDNWGLSDTASVVIDVEDFDNLNPFFSHSLYHAFIPENQVSLCVSLSFWQILCWHDSTWIILVSFKFLCFVNQAGVFRTIQPEAIQAQDGDTGINMTLTYSITSGK